MERVSEHTTDRERAASGENNRYLNAILHTSVILPWEKSHGFGPIPFCLQLLLMLTTPDIIEKTKRGFPVCNTSHPVLTHSVPAFRRAQSFPK